MKFVPSSLLAATLLTACAAGPSYDSPYALVEPGIASAVRRETPVLIHEVDGQIPVDRRYGIPIQPGKHVVIVHYSHGAVEGTPEKHVRRIDLEAAPCTRYRIVARHTALTHVEWDPVVYPEPIGECIERFRRS